MINTGLVSTYSNYHYISSLVVQHDPILSIAVGKICPQSLLVVGYDPIFTIATPSHQPNIKHSCMSRGTLRFLEQAKLGPFRLNSELLVVF